MPVGYSDLYMRNVLTYENEHEKGKHSPTRMNDTVLNVIPYITLSHI